MHPPFETSPALAALPDIRHGFFGRRGGVSEGEFAALNASRAVGDDAANVAENIHKAVMALKSGPLQVAMAKQIHSADVLTITETSDLSARPEADALVTRRHGVALGILTADCAPILLADPESGVIGAAHAGWRGAVSGVLGQTVAAMEALGARAGHITAAIGPSISAENYEVGEDFAAMIAREFPESLDFVLTEGFAKPHFDVAGLLEMQGRNLGLKSIMRVGGCTYGMDEAYFSHRHATHTETRAGRQISLIALG
ncbi:peptidoglycan editing factor PgeF [Pelagibacterium montanilacus]|uniref:peptidoglycan editing factor PgeF n=1 Tax=Pelagibacterium montanilacus TaxID=2185280 RepID=UPI000F8DC84D|nr:peptidoglycan editing factor PgeF [Pelagibacterium montanilacus]